jgi:hypothetical protein
MLFCTSFHVLPPKTKLWIQADLELDRSAHVDEADGTLMVCQLWISMFRSVLLTISSTLQHWMLSPAQVPPTAHSSVSSSRFYLIEEVLTDVEQATLSPDDSDAFHAVAAGLLLVVATGVAGGVGGGLEAAGVVLPAAGRGSHGGGGEEGDDGGWMHGVVVVEGGVGVCRGWNGFDDVAIGVGSWVELERRRREKGMDTYTWSMQRSSCIVP